MTKNITREDISEYINSEFGLSKYDCNNIVNEIINEELLNNVRSKLLKNNSRYSYTYNLYDDLNEKNKI
mgnify:CR=1 FL=1